MNYLLVFIGGGLGSLARYALSLAVSNITTIRFPLATFLANMIACMVLGITVLLLHQKNMSEHWLNELLIVGFCGGFSTFSTFSNDTVKLVENGNYAIAIANVLLSISVGFVLIFLLRTTR